tara:strand:+ start:7943 stop:8212 length:270 start_codon:yes stop_codon:yes gene_type:complete
MDSLLLFLLLLGGTPAQPVAGASTVPARIQAVASVRVLRGQAIAFGPTADGRDPSGAEDGGAIAPLAPIRSTAVSQTVDDQVIQLQEFQ